MSRPWKGGRDPETRGRVSPAKVPVPERAVHTFTVTVESDDDAETIADRMNGDWLAVYKAKIEHVHSRFPSGMMAYPKRDA